MDEKHRLGFQPTISKIFHDMYRCSGMALAVAEIEGDIDTAVLKQSLCLLQKRHPLLQAEIVSDERYYYYNRDRYRAMTSRERLQKIPLKVISGRDQRTWQDIAEQEIDKDFTANELYLWRAVLVPSREGTSGHRLIMIYHHAITDGISIRKFINDLLSLCGDFPAVSRQYADDRELPRLEPPETMFGSFPRNDHIPDAGPGEEDASSKTESIPYERYASLQDRKSRILYFQADPSVVISLRERCKRENTTVNNALTAALLRAVYLRPSGQVYAALNSALSLRRYCDPVIAEDYFGCFFTMLQTFHRVSQDEPFWDCVRTCRSVLERERLVRQRRRFLPPAFYRAFLSGAMTRNVAQCDAEKRFNGGLMLSNAGVVDYPAEYGSIKVRSLYCVVSQLSGLYQLFLGVHTLHGKLYCCMSWAEPLLSSTTARNIADSFIAEIIGNL